MKLLFVKEQLSWPRRIGHDIHCFHMMRALGELGHTLALATLLRPDAEAIHGLSLERLYCLTDADDAEAQGAIEVRLSRQQERFRSYWDIDAQRIGRVGRIAQTFAADAVVVVGLNVLPYLGAVQGPMRVWYAADEWVWHHLSQVRLLRRGTWGNVREALMKGLYERAYGPLLDRVWVVSEADQRAMRWVAGTRNVDVVANGVDGNHFAPRPAAERERSCVFWGRLDFGPNVQALQWFCRRVWPAVRRAAPDAQFTIYGFQPTPAVQALAGSDGIALIPDLPDLREEIARHQLVVLPFVSGGGIKNKLLEAAAQGKAIVCTPRACGGLRNPDNLPLCLASGTADWVRELPALWADEASRKRLGAAAREWILKHHTWKAAARIAIDGLEKVLEERKSA